MPRNLVLMAAHEPMLARLVVGGKVMGFVTVTEPQTRAEAAAMQVSIPLRHLEAEPALSHHIEPSCKFKPELLYQQQPCGELKSK